MNIPRQPTDFALTEFVDVCDREDLFEVLDNQRVLELSRLGGGDGFSKLSVLRRSTGIEHRRILRPGIAPIDVATTLADRLQRQVDLNWNDCPAILLCHSHIDSSRSKELAQGLAEHLCVPESKVHGFNLGCGGFLQLIKRGAAFASTANPNQHVPLLSVEIPEQWHDAADKAFCGIVSAGAGATTITRGAGHRLFGFDAREVEVPAEKRNDGTPLFTHEFCEGFDFRGRPQTREVMHMDGESVFLSGVELMLEGCREALKFAGVGNDCEVITVPHQPSGKLLKTLIATGKIDFPKARFLSNLESFGNTLSSTIPIALSRIDEVSEANGCSPPSKGDIVLLTAAGICMTRKADHMTQGFAALEW